MTPFLWGLGLGLIGAHILWAAIFVGWWYLLIRRSPDKSQEQVTQDFKAVRDSLRRAQSRDPN